ncbi:hypothetical protein H5410_035898 [Solanum commersonii]|uniref:Uncharacterized protein n=1 Tax=Solanum commersonii TaxID=4109 RepID=A0A9J5Y3W4_SOLCO|nr:hypothetical protein H5410_035898 [Solanum commersonii]
MTNRRITEQFCEDALCFPMVQNAKMLKEKVERIFVDIVLELEDLKIFNSKKLEPMAIGLSWVQLERVNLRPSPTLSARESEWAKVEVVLKCIKSVLERN